eukprot:TRINITY_DN5115_c0_g1_i6.p1 TRINITY_DN5115_c0_g1~~TRINITY_DN5115_c0_g1_i6.p1  ORF type:complete len:395 (+),score=65.43 TRINITY_DN5115_c0_g1_i6:86-1270(+)
MKGGFCTVVILLLCFFNTNSPRTWEAKNKSQRFDKDIGTCTLDSNDLLSMDIYDAFEILFQHYINSCGLEIDDTYKSSFQTENQNTENHSTSSLGQQNPNVIPNLGIHSESNVVNGFFITNNTLRKESINPFQALTLFYRGTKGARWNRNSGWTRTDIPICKWYGITCQPSCSQSSIQNNLCPIVKLDLSANNLYGVFRDILPHLEVFPTIVELDLSWNGLTGDIPVINLPVVEIIVLSRNDFEGTVSDFSNLANLKVLNLHDSKLLGTIPNIQLPLLQELDLGFNSLDGSLPAISVPILAFLDISSNYFSSFFPTINIPSIQSLVISGNSFTGTLPSWNLPQADNVDVSNNPFTGLVFSMINNTHSKHFIQKPIQAFAKHQVKSQISYFQTCN